MAYETINWSNVSNARSLLGTVNTTSGGYFWIVMVGLIVGVILMSLLNFGIEVALLASLFIGMIFGILLLYLGLIPFWVVGFLVGAEIFVSIYLMFSSSKNP